MPGIHFLLVFSILVSGGLGVGLLRLGRIIGATETSLPVTADWIDELSAERYRPMARLLAPDDLAILKKQPGFTAPQEVQFRTERARIFRGYLHQLHADFRRVSMAMRILMVQSRDDRPDLARALVQRRALFAAGIAVAHVRLFLYQLGIGGVETSGLMNSFESLRLELRALLPPGSPLQA